MTRPNHVLVMLMIEFFESEDVPIRKLYTETRNNYIRALARGLRISGPVQDDLNALDVIWTRSMNELMVNNTMLIYLRGILAEN